MIALFVAMCAIGIGVLGCVLYLVWNGLGLALEYARMIRERRGTGAAAMSRPESAGA